MATLYLTEQGTKVRRRGNRLLVERFDDGQIVAEVPINKVDRVFVFGQVYVSTGVLHHLLRHGIDTAFFTANARLLGRLLPETGKDVSVRLEQYRVLTDPDRSLILARKIVAAKIESSSRVLARIDRTRGDGATGAVVQRLGELANDAKRCDNLASLRGIEGAAAALYFPALGTRLPERFQFHQRTRRPPGDPANAVLSFGYGILFNEIAGVVTAVGLDPYLGCYHTNEYGRMSLALDLLEEFRAAVVDRLLLTLFNRGELKEEDFVPGPNGGVWLAPSGKKRLLRLYETTMQRAFIPKGESMRTSLRKLLLRQAYRFRDAIVGDPETYEPYRAEL